MTVSLIILGYLIGAIPFALLVARHVAGTDVRYAGSGNVGAANVFRTVGTSTGLVVMALDISKGSAAVLIAGALGGDDTTRAFTGLAAVVGHSYPIWLRFRGGKGVATACGVFAVLTPVATAPAAAVFVILVALTRYVSLGSMGAAITLPAFAYLTKASGVVVGSAALAGLLILYRHRANLGRLQAGRERRLGERGAPPGG